jgi:hypothetical protein
MEIDQVIDALEDQNNTISHLRLFQIIQQAEAGDRDADFAVRELAIEYLSRRKEMPTSLAAFVQRVLLQALHK